MLKPRSRIGKYRVVRRLAEGGYATVYEAVDTIEDIRVALKVPHAHLGAASAVEDFQREVRLTARLDHPNVLTAKNAEFIGEQFVIVSRLGDGTLDDRIGRRLPLKLAVEYAGQMLEGLAYAHERRVIHCDIKPENLIFFNGRLRLADFGIAKLTMRTMSASGSGTLGYVAPEQAMGRPSFRSDVFAMGLVIYQMFTGRLPSWPFEWPLPGLDGLRRRTPRDFVEFFRRCIVVDERRRYRDAAQMLAAFRRVRPRLLGDATRRKRRRVDPAEKAEALRERAFQRRFGKALEMHHQCRACHGHVSEAMRCCPWCGTDRKVFRGETRFPYACKRCKRGMKADWTWCAWCYGPAQGPHGTREYTDRRYTHRCSNRACERKDLMPFMRYCPWCRRKVTRRWRIEGGSRCSRCSWDVLDEHWHHCPWCAKKVT